MVTDDKGLRGIGACPGATTCTVHGASHISGLGRVVDEDGDALHADVEVVPHGQPFTGTPTFSSAIGPDGNVAITFAGLAAGTTYDFAIRVSDALGAVATAGVPPVDLTLSPDGWVTQPRWGFEQGPCTGAQCACLRAEMIYCGIDADCCSGVCAADISIVGWGKCR